MKILLFFTCLLIFFLSCNKSVEPKPDCKYGKHIAYPTDTTLFLAFRMNQQDYQYYQDINVSADLGASNTFLKINGQTILRNTYSIILNESLSDGHYSNPDPNVNLNFYDTTLMKSSSNIRVHSFSNHLLTNYKFIMPPNGSMYAEQDMALKDTVSLRGVSLTLNQFQYSTDYLITFYRNNIDSISKYLWSESYFRINKVEPVCENYKIIEGEFSTLVMRSTISEFYRLENGHFRILIN